jgi:LysR substrate binding domain
VAAVLAPHLISRFAAEAPQVTVDVQRMWLPSLTEALVCGRIDVAMTCGLIPAPDGMANEVFCAEPLLVGLRPDHRLARRDTIALTDLAHYVLGLTPDDLFPAWALSQRQALEAAGISPPTIDLAGYRPGRHPLGRPARRRLDPADRIARRHPIHDSGPSRRAQAARAVHLAVESQPRSHHGGRPVRARRAHRRAAARLAYAARSPAPSQ